ncbi:hypothetical protein O6H91_02G141200 [Diphasiastrum complanatum]|uniref:Uncharacterized protein n=1 Tax=Diphasiastrum complanatum TaxID=34168 RepID=A0ACC2ELP9_DIPCM|nr:hypothetical protein O6H91_02G141200 [Diphasiastrum complanatum]
MVSAQESTIVSKRKKNGSDGDLAASAAATGHPKKRFYRARAHSNPLSDSQFPVPISPAHFDWSQHFPAFFPQHNLSHAGISVSASDQRGDDMIAHVSASTLAEEQQPSEGSVPGSTGADAFAPSVRSLQNEEAAMREEIDGLAVGLENGEVETSPGFSNGLAKVRFADVGCGFGGLLVKLSVMFPETLMLGMELRDKVTEYVKERIAALRIANPGQYQNISVIRTNSMKYLPNYFEKGQLQKMFFLFPDPHFKEKNHRRRIITLALLAEYAYILGIGGILYTITDVEELGEWMKSNLEAHPLFERLSEKELTEDPVVPLLTLATEEGQKVARNNGQTFCSVYRRIPAKDYLVQVLE